jgi:tryptophanyl-tRNA synthetase
MAPERRGVETIIVIADHQVIVDRDWVGPIEERVRSLVTDDFAVDLDPDRTTIFTHSSVPKLHHRGGADVSAALQRAAGR